MFSWKKAKKIQTILLLSLFIERVFYSYEDNVCTCDSLADPCSSSKPLTMESFRCLRWLYVSRIHRAWRGFKSLNLRGTLTSPGATPFDSCLPTLSAYHALNLLEINFFADWLMLISKSWNLFVRLCGTITNSQLFLAHNSFISSLSWPLKVSLIIKALLFRVAKLLLFGGQIWKDITLNRSSHFPKLDQWFGVYVTWKLEGNVNFDKHLFDLPW